MNEQRKNDLREKGKKHIKAHFMNCIEEIEEIHKSEGWLTQKEYEYYRNYILEILDGFAYELEEMLE